MAYVSKYNEPLKCENTQIFTNVDQSGCRFAGHLFFCLEIGNILVIMIPSGQNFGQEQFYIAVHPFGLELAKSLHERRSWHHPCRGESMSCLLCSETGAIYQHDK